MASWGTGLVHAAGWCLAAAEFAYLVLAVLAVIRFRQRPTRAPLHRPPAVSVLIPAHRDFPGFESCIRSVCEQDYPEFEIVFGLHSHADTAKPVIERVIRDYPHRRIALVVDDRMLGANPKNCNLANMFPAARYDVVAMVDSDVRVGPDFLATVVAELAADDEATGAVTCLYKAAAPANFASRLGALAINDWFIPSGLVDIALRDASICYGAAIVARRKALNDIGGFEAMASAVAQDYVLGQELRRRGYGIRLAPYIVETIVAEPDLKRLFLHERRWNRAVRACRPLDHALSVVTHALPLVALLLLLPPSAAGLAAVGVLLGLRLLLHYVVRARIPIEGGAEPWLVPLREALSLVVWASTLASNTMRWGDRKLIVTRGGVSMAVAKEN
jgi:ceramide glucosyltransferase